jgi:transforming growth factor-beta-induced protein
MNKLIRRNVALLALPLAFALGACDDDDPVQVEDPLGTIVGVAQDAGSFSTLLTALDVAGLTPALEGEGPFTVFAPTDDAFASISPETLNDLLADTEKLAAVLTYHVVAGRFTASDVTGLSSAPTLNGKAVSISTDGGAVRVDGATVIATDIEASNGIIHVIDGVLLPEPIENIVQLAKSSGIFNTLLAAIEAAGLGDALQGEGPFTVFAPTDDAFAAIDAEVLGDLVADTDLLTAVLTYHVVPGLFMAEQVVNTPAFTTLNGKNLLATVEEGMVKVGGATVVATDFLATNGVVHVIDQVLLPESIADIVQVARGAGIFNTLLAAVEAAGLTDVLKGEGPFTVFAPTDEAFSAIPADALAALLADPSALAAVLTYHVAPGALRAVDVLGSPTLTTVNGAEATISIDGEGLPRIDDAIITATDIDAKNGVIHIIDRVIFPQ